MTPDVFLSPTPQVPALPRLHEAGIAAAASTGRARPRRARSLPPARELLRRIAISARGVDTEARTCLVENLRLVRSALKGLDGLNRFLRRCPVVTVAFGVESPRVCEVARDYLRVTGGRFNELELVRFLQGYQEAAQLEAEEIDYLKPALQFAILERLAVAPGAAWPELLSSLHRSEDAFWRELSESVSVVDSVLRRDPAAVYGAMDMDSREGYRGEIASLARRSTRTEGEIAEKAVALAAQASGSGDPRRAHVGFFLVGQGAKELRAAVGYRRTLADRLAGVPVANPVLYPATIEALTFVIVAALVSQLNAPGAVLAAMLLLVLPASQAAVDILNHFIGVLVHPRALPKLDFSEGIPDDCATIVAVPALLLNEGQTRELVLDLEIRYLANRDRNLFFALLTDAADSDRAMDERDELAAVCGGLIESLNRKYGAEGRTPFYLFHRNRIFNASEGRWIGWERKRGKLLDLNRLLGGGANRFSLTAGDMAVLPRVRYVITLDADTQLPRDSAARLIGAIAHPLNRPVVDPATRTVVEGYGILQPRIGISVQSASRSRLASLYSGQTGFDIYTRAVSEVYQDLFGEGIYTGKGIYDVDAMRAVLEDRFPDNVLLSHDLIEGAYARVALLSDVELIDDYPSHFSAYSRRKHRWVRGDWQILRWLLARVPDGQGRMIRNPIGVLSQWKIVDNLRRSVLEPSMFLLFAAGWLWLPGNCWYWTAAALAILMLPSAADVLFSIMREPPGRQAFADWAGDLAIRFATDFARAVLSLVFLLHQALLSADAIARSLLRVSFTRRKLLEWETAAEAETETKRKSTVDTYLERTPWFSVAIGLAVWLIRPAALSAAIPILVLWFSSWGISAWHNRAPRAAGRKIRPDDLERLRDCSLRICRFFEEWSSPATNWLIPDNVREDGRADLKLSPTNLGLLLNARIAAVHFGALTLDGFVSATRKTLEQADRLEKFRGHLLNWYSIESMAPVEPLFVSTVDSGNLAACLWTLKQAALAFAADTPALAGELGEIAETCERWVREMDFGFLYQRNRKALSVGYDVAFERLEASSYDLLASEARIASFVAIAKGDVPLDAWRHLGRAHTAVRGERALLSWTGTMFEYLMPLLWMRHRPGTITERSAAAVVRFQRRFAAGKGVPWGISESGFCVGEGLDYGYCAFGMPELALKPADTGPLVVSPYSTFLALGVDPAAAMANLRREEALGWLGRYGFYEAVDFGHTGPEIVRSWMAHHQGMSLLAACNLLFDRPMERYFHAEPQVLATELLLDERVPRASLAEMERHSTVPTEQALEELAG
jgi:cyclic beta-1,2-glucan synthetase